MTSKNLIDACDILLKLEQEFASEEAKLSEVSNEHAMKIDELDQQITTFRRNEDVDFRVFSPRNLSTVTSDKIKTLEGEKKQLEREKKEADKQLRYYSGKTEMIGRVLDLLRSGLKEESDEDSSTVRNSRNPFSFLDEDSSDIVEFEDETDEVASLFASSDRSEEDPADKTESVGKSSVGKEDVSFVQSVGVPVDEVERVCHKVEFCEKIISNDGIRAKLEIKNIVADLKELIRAYRS
ncbi:MAG: hypothetical protein IKO16_10835 [Lachnospiraceae bacterium]|nr:hypothetical protein [Lachnospiraceae bacterium]